MKSHSSSKQGKPIINGRLPAVPPALNLDFMKSSPSSSQAGATTAPQHPLEEFRLPSIRPDPEAGHAVDLSPDGSEDSPQSPEAEGDDAAFKLEPEFQFESTRRLFSRANGLWLAMLIGVLLLLCLTITPRLSSEPQRPLLMRKSSQSASAITNFITHEPDGQGKHKAYTRTNTNVAAHVSKYLADPSTSIFITNAPKASLTPLAETPFKTDLTASTNPERATSLLLPNQCNGNPQDHRHFYLRYDFSEHVKVFDCEKFPHPGHKQFSEFYYANADGTPAPFFTQQVHENQALFLACPASRPRMRIQFAKFGRYYAVHETTGKPLEFPRAWEGDYTDFDFTDGLNKRCVNKRFCCINSAKWSFRAKEAGMISWTCKPGEVIRKGPVIRHGDMEIHQSEITVLPHLIGTNSHPQPPLPAPPDDNDGLNATAPVEPLNTRCTFSVHHSPHSWDSRDQANGQGGGFIHQLSALTATIGIAALSECDVNSEGFYPDFDLLHSVPLGLVIDLAQLSKNLHAHKMLVNIIDKVMDTHLYPFTSIAGGMPVAVSMLRDLKNPPEMQYNLPPHVEFRRQQLPQFALFGHLFPHWMFEDTLHIARLRDFIVADMPFAQPFQHAADALMQGLNLTSGDYITIHFRLEADAAEFAVREHKKADDWRENVFNHIIGVLNDQRVPSDAIIYLSTGLNATDRYVRQFQALFPNAVTKDILLEACKGTAAPSVAQKNEEASMCLKPSQWNPQTNPVLHALSRIPWTAHTDECGLIRGDRFENREYWAVLDWLMARESRLFVGARPSMFSKMMNKIVEGLPKKWLDLNGVIKQTSVLV